MKTLTRCALGLSLLGCASAHAGGNVVGSIGERTLDDDQFWGEVRRQPLVGVLADFSFGPAPVSLAVGLQASAKKEDASDGSGDEITGSVADLTVGAKLMPNDGMFRPYVSGGLASVGASGKVEGPGVDTDYNDQSFGWYASAGGYLRLGSHFEMGIDLRWIGGTDINFGGSKGDANSFTTSLLIGYGWD
jgi:hypothetical protein